MLVSDASNIQNLDGQTQLFTFVDNGNGCYEIVRFTVSDLLSVQQIDPVETLDIVQGYSAGIGDTITLPVNGGVIPTGYKLFIFKDGIKWQEGIGYNLTQDATTNVVTIEWLFPITNDIMDYQLVKI